MIDITIDIGINVLTTLNWKETKFYVRITRFFNDGKSKKWKIKKMIGTKWFT